MKYTYDSNIALVAEPKEFNKFTSREVLQYALSGLLYMPATRTHIADDIITNKHPEYRSLCLDLEDSVGSETVEEAEICLFETLQKIKDSGMKLEDLPLIFIRVRSPHQLLHLYNNFDNSLLELITGFNFPKFDSSNCEEYITNFQTIQKSINTPLYFNPIIESESVMNKRTRFFELNIIANKLSIVSDSVLNVRVGATDFCNIYGIRRKMTQSIYDINVIADCFTDIVNTFGKSYTISGPVWEYFSSDRSTGQWSTGLQRELELDKLNGFIGKTCIHPSQLKYINENHIVDNESYQDALSILGMKDGLIGVAKGFNGNKMNEVKTHSNWAKKIIGLSEIYGVKK